MRERMKSAALAVLLVTMLLLLYLSLTLGIDSGEKILARIFGVSAPSEEVELQPRAAVELRALAVCTPQGVRMPQSAAEKDEMSNAVSAIYAEAVGSAGEAQAITRQQYLNLLRAPAVYFGFDTELPLFLLRAWVGLERGQRGESRLCNLVVAAAEEQVVMAWYDTGAGEYRMSATAAAVDRLTRLCEGWRGSNAVFAFQDGGFAALCADEPVLLAVSEEKIYSVRPLELAQTGELSREVLTSFDLNPYLARVYEESGGEMVYVEGYNVLRVNGQGDLVYTAGAAGQGLSLGVSEAEADDQSLIVEGVRALLSGLNRQVGAGGVYSFNEMSAGKDGELTLLFDLTLDGRPVVSKRPAAHVTVHSGRVTYLRIAPRRFEQAGSRSILPIRQAAAVLQGRSGLRLSVRYEEKQDGLLIPALYSTEEPYGVE